LSAITYFKRNRRSQLLCNMMAHAIGFILTMIVSWIGGTSAVRQLQQSALKKDTEKQHEAAATEGQWPHAGYNQQGQECRTDGQAVYTWDDYVQYCHTKRCDPTTYWNQAWPAPCTQNHGSWPGANNQQSGAEWNHGSRPGANNQQSGASECRTDGQAVYTWDDYVQYCRTKRCDPTTYWNQAWPAPCEQNHGYAPGANKQQSGAAECRTYGGAVYTWDDYVQYCHTSGCNPTDYWNKAQPAPCTNAKPRGGDHAPGDRRRWKQATKGVAKDLAADLGSRLLDKWLPK
jgi:hypothetical protein